MGHDARRHGDGRTDHPIRAARPASLRSRGLCNEPSEATWVRQPMIASSESKRRHFLLHGEIANWDPLTRRLVIAGESCWVAPAVGVSGVEVGVRATVAGYREDLDGRRIVTQITLH